MKSKIKRSLLGVGVAAMLIGSTIVFSEPGSDSDPLVSMSYVNNKVEQLKEYIDAKTGSSKGENTTDELSVVELEVGEYLIGGAGTEIILRGGKSLPYGVEIDRGLVDVTDGKDLDNSGELLPYNHLIVIPRDDGRGAYAISNSIFMVRGKYEIK